MTSSSQMWHKRFLLLAEHIADWSKDIHTQVGAVIVGSNRRIISVGYNGFPSGVDDLKISRYNRPDKYFFTEHAERNAIYNAHFTNASPVGGHIYVTKMTCADCARAIIQCGVKHVHTWEDNTLNSRWKDSFEAAMEMYNEAEVEITLHTK